MSDLQSDALATWLRRRKLFLVACTNFRLFVDFIFIPLQFVKSVDRRPEVKSPTQRILYAQSPQDQDSQAFLQ